MEIIRHRVNQIEDLKKLEAGLGAEIDLRSQGSQIILNHDAFKEGDDFENWMEIWASGPTRGTLILNPKEDGLESAALDLMKKHGVLNFFFLDLTIPTTVRFGVRNGIREIAVRVSEYETLESARKFSGKVDWAWLDSFTGDVKQVENFPVLSNEFKVCLVSPELQGYSAETYIPLFKNLSSGLAAVCTKRPELWGWTSNKERP